MKQITIFHDASHLAAGYSIYITSSNNDGDKDTIIAKAGHKLGRRSIPVMELLSRSVALEGLFELVPVLSHFFSDLEFKIVLITDSICSANYSLQESPKVVTS